ncbi:MAG TPA: outer membrane protein assembly factor BamE [Candidatus Acidoferrum sp.]|nr:outer membrane protein assembly factor BamE [Candidatus Acidoferrum sp.]
MKTQTAALLLAALLAAGCQTSSKQMNKVHLGMTEAQVVKVLGTPASRAESKDGSLTLYYTLRENMVGSLNAPYSVRLVAGKVDFYGRDNAAQGGPAGAVIMPVPMAR